MKLLLWGVVLVFIIMWLMRGKKTASSDPSTASTRRHHGMARIAEPMLQCAQCHVHFPASEAVTTAAGAVYCSEEHRVLHGKR